MTKTHLQNMFLESKYNLYIEFLDDLDNLVKLNTK